MSSPERWVKIAGSTIYSISTWGRVRNDRKNHIKVLACGRYGSQIVVLSDNNGRTHKTRNATQIMAQLMPPRPSPQHGIFHLDGDRTNNAVDNLKWMTNSERVLYGYKHKRRHVAVHMPPPLNNKEKQQIRSMWALGHSQVKIGKLLGRCNSTISKFLSGRYYEELAFEHVSSDGTAVPIT